MNSKSYVDIEVEVNERLYKFSMPVGAPFIECHEAALKISDCVIELAKQTEDQLKNPQKDEVIN